MPSIAVRVIMEVPGEMAITRFEIAIASVMQSCEIESGRLRHGGRREGWTSDGRRDDRQSSLLPVPVIPLSRPK